MPVHSNPASDTLVRAAIDLRRFSWIRPLVAAYSSDFPSVASLFAGNPADPEAWTQTIARVQRSPRDRAARDGLPQDVSRLFLPWTARGVPPDARWCAADAWWCAYGASERRYISSPE